MRDEDSERLEVGVSLVVAAILVTVAAIWALI